MNIIYFAHNGVDHGTEAEAAAHAGDKLWIVALTVIMAGLVYFAVKTLNRQTDDSEDQEKND